MKNKTFILMSAFLLTATMLMCFTSAVEFSVSGNGAFTPSVSSQEITITNKDIANTMNISFNSISFNDTIFRVKDLTDNIYLTSADKVFLNKSGSAGNYSKRFKIEPTTEINYSSWKLKEKHSGNLKIYESENTSNYKEVVVSIENNEVCDYTLSKSYLEMKLNEPDVEGFGEGDDWKFYPFDEFNVEVEFENKHKTLELTDIEVEWGIYDTETLDWYIEEEAGEFDLEEKDDVSEFIEYKFREDVDDMEDGKYIFYVWANAVLDDDVNTPICVSKYEDVSFEIERHFVILDNIRVPENSFCNQEVSVLANVWNIGSKDQEDLYIKVKNEELGINERVNIAELDSYEYKETEFSFSIPKDADEKTYELVFSVYDEEGELYDDGDDDESVFRKSLKVEGDCIVNKARAIVSSPKMVSEKAVEGKELIVSTTISNTGNLGGTFKISVDGEDEWADSVLLSKTSLVLGPGESEEINVSLMIKEDVEGKQEFNVNVLGSEGLVKQPVTVDVTKKGASKLVLGIVLISIILIVAIVIVVLRIADTK